MLQQLFGTDVGLLSLFTLGFIIVMGFYLWKFVAQKMDEDEKNSKK